MIGRVAEGVFAAKWLADVCDVFGKRRLVAITLTWGAAGNAAYTRLAHAGSSIVVPFAVFQVCTSISLKVKALRAVVGLSVPIYLQSNYANYSQQY